MPRATPSCRQGGARSQVDAQGHVAASALGVFNVSGAVKQGDNLFTGTAAGRATGSVRQGELEDPGIDPVHTMVDMISSMRAYEAGQKAIQTIDETLQENANQVGSLGGAMMLEGLYAAASGMEAQQHAAGGRLQRHRQRLDAGLSVAPRSASTTCSIRAAALPAGARWPPAPARRRRSSVAARPRARSRHTGQPLDVAIIGPGFLQVRRPDGTIGLTRNGTLQLELSGAADQRARHAGAAADHRAAGHPADRDQDRAERRRARRRRADRTLSAGHRGGARTACCRPATAPSPPPRPAARRERPPAPRCGRARSRPRTSIWPPR